MYKKNIDPANNYVTQIVEHTLLKVQVIVEEEISDDNRPPKGPEEFVYFLEDDNDFTIREQCEKICNKMGYKLNAIGEYKRITHSYDVRKLF